MLKQPQVFKQNPRTITPEEQARLKQDLSDLGDLGGIVHDLNTNQIVGGHQRLTVMLGQAAGKFKIKDADIEIVKTYKLPTKTGTVGEGFILWNGERYGYRQVRYTKKQFERANIVANLRGGKWDDDILMNNFTSADLAAFGFSTDFISAMELPTFKEYGEDVADDLKMCKCSKCGHEHAAPKSK